MSLSLYFVLFVAPLVLCANVSIDPATLHNVFGFPYALNTVAAANQPSASAAGYSAQAYPVQGYSNQGYGVKVPPANSQVAAVTPANGTLVDLDYWDSVDEYTPSATDYDKFDWTLTKRVASSSNENFLLSPLGLKLALAILTEAATGNTQAELSNVLGFDLDRVLVRRKFSAIIESLQNSKSDQYILNLGNRIYVDDIAEPRQRFAAIAQEFYKTELTKIDFDNPAVAARDINNWVANKTDGHITNLVGEDDITGMVVLVLNTLYFKGTWRHQFAPNATKLAPFYVSPTVQKQVPFMNVRDNFYYADSTKYDAKILRMPYKGMKFSMYIIVPNSLTGLPRILNGLSDLRSELYYLQEHVVDVTLPKFQFDYTSLLDGILKELGIRQAFEDTASFPGIARGQSLLQRLRISKVLQRSGIEVNEIGSIAYSATEISLVNKFGEDAESNRELIANKPFLFFIQDEATRQLLFTGRVSNPALVDGAFKLQFLAFAHVYSLDGQQQLDQSRLNFFDTDLLRYSCEDRKGNVVVSPASMKSTLAMILEGAGGATAAEIRSALRLSPDKDEFREQLNFYLSMLQGNKTGAILQNANAVFVSDKLKLMKDYELMLQKVYMTDVSKMDFKDPFPVAEHINSWVNNRTKGLIPTIIEPVQITPYTQILLTNALYFKSNWQHPFDSKNTRSGCFHLQGVCRNVAMMELHAELNYAYVENLRAHAVELPYEGAQYSMVLLVPQDRDGLAPLVRDLPYMSLPQISMLFEPTDVTLLLPRFTVDYSEDMIGPLRSMRITSLFSPTANLSGIFEGDSPQINSIFHRVHLAVDESGTVAAAATAAMVIPLIHNGVQIRVDHPFALFIRDNRQGLVLFEGKIEEPTAYVEKNGLAGQAVKNNTGNPIKRSYG
ncbi:uncharacterized protein LOC126379741 [Pectinophora gossypiella]|nr:uncharacterized protein LOC126379741 [Pectinophora gossypiella]